MSIQSERLDCVFQVPDQPRHPALAHLFWHKDAGRVFWYGVAQFAETPALPEGAAGGSVAFDDGRVGRVVFRDRKMGPGGYSEVAFVGLDQLGVPTASRPNPGNDPSPQPDSGETDRVEFRSLRPTEVVAAEPEKGGRRNRANHRVRPDPTPGAPWRPVRWP